MGLKLPRRIKNGTERVEQKSGLRLPRRLQIGGKEQGAAYKRSAQQEKQVAERLTHVVRGSGRSLIKGDVRAKNIVRVECKTTEKESYRITLKDFEKLELVSHSAGEVPVFVIEFIDKRGKVKGELAIMKFNALQEYVACHRSED